MTYLRYLVSFPAPNGQKSLIFYDWTYFGVVGIHIVVYFDSTVSVSLPPVKVLQPRCLIG
jgi:hypothetical protein